MVAFGVTVGVELIHSYTSLLDFPEMKLTDWRFTKRDQRQPPEQIAIVEIDDMQMKHMNRLSPIPRNLLADIIYALSQSGAKTIVVDALLDKRLSDAMVWEDIALRKAIEDAGNVILPFVFEPDPKGDIHVIYPDPYFSEVAAGIGLAHVYESTVDYTARWEKPLTFTDSKLAPLPSLSLAAYSHYTDQPVTNFTSLKDHRELELKLNRRLDVEGQIFIDYAGPRGSFASYSSFKLLEGEIPPEYLKDRVTFVGVTWTGSRDYLYGPFGSWLPGPRRSQIPGVEIQANCLHTLLEDHPIRQLTFLTNLSILFAVILLASELMILTHPFLAALSGAGLLWLWIYFGVSMFVRNNVFIQMAPPILAVIMSYPTTLLVRFFFVNRYARYLRRTFSRYLDAKVIDQLLTQKDLRLGGSTKTVTILFSDIRGYTQRSSKMTPEAIVNMLNTYFGLMSQIAVQSHAGFLDKYIGDGMMVVFGMFGDPSGTDGGLPACEAALEMTDKLKEAQKHGSLLDFRVGIGIHTGEVVVGNIGSPQHMDYTVIGSAVNIASRIEAQTKIVGAEVLISESTYQSVKDHVETQIIGHRSLPGIEEPIMLYQLLGIKNSLNS